MEGQEVGKTLTKLGKYGFILHTNVTLSKSVFGKHVKKTRYRTGSKTWNRPVLGLEHANTDGKLMSRKLYLDSDAADVISDCQVKAVFTS